MTKIFGDFFYLENSHEYLTMKFSPNRLSIQDRWRNNGLSADFLADYWTTFFPAYDHSSQKKQQQIKNVIGYIANELLENTMKFHCAETDVPISMTLHLCPHELFFYISNCVDAQAGEKFQKYINILLTENIEELYLKQLESNALDETHTISQMGLLTILHDYHAKLAWKFETIQDRVSYQLVITKIQLAI